MRRVTPFDSRAYYYYYPAEVKGCKNPAVIGSGGFSPLSLSPHLWLDPSDLTTLFQDSAMTTPVTADGDPVGAILDKSGNDIHLIQATAGSRPLYKTAGGLHWLESDGTDDVLDTTYTSLAQPLERVSAWRRMAGGDAGGPRLIFDAGAGNGQLYAILGGDQQLRIHSGVELALSPVPAEDADFVATERHSGASSRLAVDNGSYTTGDAGANATLGIALFARPNGTVPSQARFYGLVQRGSAFTDPEIAQLRTYLAAKQGRVL